MLAPIHNVWRKAWVPGEANRKFTALSGFAGERSAAVAEFTLRVQGFHALETEPGSDTGLPRARTATEEIDE